MIRKLAKKRAHQTYKSPTGKRLPGCSTICKLGDSNEGLMRWAWKLGQEGLDYLKVRDEAAEIGTCTHFLIETFLSGQEADMSEYSPLVTDKARKGFEKFHHFWQDGGYEVVVSELQMVSLIYEFGGTLDCVAKDREGRRTLLDFKCTSRIHPTMGYQLAGYRQLFDENHPGDELERFAIIRIPKDEDRVEEKWHHSLDWQWRVFLAQLNLYTTLKEKQ